MVFGGDAALQILTMKSTGSARAVVVKTSAGITLSVTGEMGWEICYEAACVLSFSS